MDHSLRAFVAEHNGSATLRRLHDLPVAQAGGGAWRLQLETSAIGDGCVQHRLAATLESGTASSCSVGLEVTLSGWSTACTLVMPGLVYEGNRFPAAKLPYPPKLPQGHPHLQAEAFIGDIPRLSSEPGPSRIDVLSGALAFPCIALRDPSSNTGLIIEFPARACGADTGVVFEENAARDAAVLRISAPGVREARYTMLDTATPSEDRAADFESGSVVELAFRVHSFACPDAATLFARLFDLRARLASEQRKPSVLPLSQAAHLIESHYHRDMWWPEAGLFRVDGGREVLTNPYQTGWCGGLIAEYALMGFSADALTLERCSTHLDNATGSGMSPSGLPFGKYSDGWRSDCHYESGAFEWRRELTLIRRHGDALLYLVRTLRMRRSRGLPIPEQWLAATRRLAEALVSLWKRSRSFGQWVRQDTAEIVVAGSASGALIPGALAEAYLLLRDPAHIATALEAADLLHASFTKRGLTTGGPGDALQTPDSESAYALVEAFMSLHDVTGHTLWLERAKEAAHQFASWVMAWNYPFPERTEFGRLGILNNGAVIANSQNGHGGPGICTHSGLGLLKLFRVTGDRRYLELARDIARALPQFVSREDRPIVANNGQPLPSGWINERCSTTDWDNNLGGVFFGPCWCEVSLMLTRAELPGVYLQTDTAALAALDNLEAAWDGETLAITNTTAFDAETTVLAESSADAKRPLGPDPLVRAWRVVVPAGGTTSLAVRVKP